MAQRFSTLISLSTNSHLHAGKQYDYKSCKDTQSPSEHYGHLLKLVVLCGHPPVFEGVVNNRLQNQLVTNVGRATEMEHVDGPQGRVSVTQST